MVKLKFLLTTFLMSLCLSSFSQDSTNTGTLSNETKVIAVVNRANWCLVCKANEERLNLVLNSYSTKGLSIVVNDLTNDTTIAKSKSNLKKSSIYKQIFTKNRKGLGKMAQACGLIHGKEKQIFSGVIIFINAKTFKVINETSISISNDEMKNTIENLLKN